MCRLRRTSRYESRSAWAKMMPKQVVLCSRPITRSKRSDPIPWSKGRASSLQPNAFDLVRVLQRSAGVNQ
jgi:hypothetical protein